MKNIFIITGISTLAACPLWAIEGESDLSQPPLQIKPVEGAQTAPRENPTPYIGVASTAMIPALADHLGLKPGEGVIAGAVMPGSPAEKAGIVVHDVITRLGDRKIGSTQELSKSVSELKPGDSVKLTVIHKGKTRELDVELAERPQELTAHQSDALDQLNLDGVPEHLAERVRRMIQGNLADSKFDSTQKMFGQTPQMDEALKDMVKRMNNMMGDDVMPDGDARSGIKIQQGASLHLMDEQGTIELKSNQDSKEITVRDKDNNITWSGPWDTDQDKAAAPEDVRNRVERLNIEDGGQGIRLNFPR